MEKTEVIIGIGDRKQKVTKADDLEFAKLMVLQEILLQLKRLADK